MAQIQGQFDVSLSIPIDVTPDFPKSGLTPCHFQITLVDLSTEILAVSCSLNPECEHVQGDMRSVRPGREFDAVFIPDAIARITTGSNLGWAIETTFMHCRSGDVSTALFTSSSSTPALWRRSLAFGRRKPSFPAGSHRYRWNAAGLIPGFAANYDAVTSATEAV